MVRPGMVAVAPIQPQTPGTSAARVGADTTDEDNRDATQSRDRFGEEHGVVLHLALFAKYGGHAELCQLDRSLRDERPFASTP